MEGGLVEGLEAFGEYALGVFERVILEGIHHCQNLINWLDVEFDLAPFHFQVFLLKSIFLQVFNKFGKLSLSQNFLFCFFVFLVLFLLFL